ncbi:uncharacterized protein [Bemisia tabaci]|uniref:uncharacterized protein n=1 Tax=Bemisia tabaci TaxID=7038 RepID=UPI003B283B20
MSRAAKIIAAALLEDSVEHDTESDEAFSDVDPTYEYESDTSSCPSGVSERTMALLMDSPPSGANAPLKEHLVRELGSRKALFGESSESGEFSNGAGPSSATTKKSTLQQMLTHSSVLKDITATEQFNSDGSNTLSNSASNMSILQQTFSRSSVTEKSEAQKQSKNADSDTSIESSVDQVFKSPSARQTSTPVESSPAMASTPVASSSEMTSTPVVITSSIASTTQTVSSVLITTSTPPTTIVASPNSSISPIVFTVPSAPSSCSSMSSLASNVATTVSVSTADVLPLMSTILSTSSIPSGRVILNDDDNDENGIDLFNLVASWVRKHLVRSTDGLGRSVLLYYDTHKTLDDDKKRCQLATILVNAELFEDPSHKISSFRFLSIASAICKCFPTENESTYYIPYAPKDGLGKKHNAKGKLYDAYKRIRRTFMAEGLIPGTKKRKRIETNEATFIGRYFPLIQFFCSL